MSNSDPDNAPTELPFQAEVQKVLALVINSLYTHKEVFLRELVSNASDALDKARLLVLTRKDVTAHEGEARISILLDEDKRMLTIEDNGIGMTKDEVIQNLGTIARSGSAEFMKAWQEAAKSPEESVRIIGQFGVGFYAAFMVASRVDVHTRSMLPGASPVLWRSSGTGGFTVLPGEREQPGTRVVLFLKEDEREYAKAWRVKEIIKKYSDFVQFPIALDGEVVNRSSAIWTLPKAKVSDEEHTEFFRRITGFDAQTPLARVHMSIEAPVQFHALLYVPEKAPFDLYNREHRGVRLYAKRVLIAEDYPNLVAPYLRFLRGVVDSEDLPLNVSRELLQQDRNLVQIETQITKAVLRALKELADTDADKYLRFYGELGRILKEGVAIDARHKGELAELCRFESLRSEPGKLMSLRAYVDAMPSEQREIFYLTGPSRRALEGGPHVEGARKRGLDVLLMTDPIDEWVVQALADFDKRRLRNIAQGDVDLGPEPDAPAVAEVAHAIAAVKKALGDRVSDVRVSKRLTESVSCLVAPEGGPTANMQRLMRMMDGKTEASPRILEFNPGHPIIKNLEVVARRSPDSPKLLAWAELIYHQALLAEGVLEDPASLVTRIQELLTEASAAEVAREE
jgi:molecular chaperone HtpG